MDGNRRLEALNSEANAISEQSVYYDMLQKVYSIWICPDPAKKRRNGIFRYHTMEEIVYGTPYAVAEQYDLTEVIVINLGEAEKSSENEILDLLNVLFSSTIFSDEKKKRLSTDYNISMTEEFESEVTEMCNLSDAVFELGEERGKEIGKEIGQNNILMLMQKLFTAGRFDDAQRATVDGEFCVGLLQEFNLV